MIITISYKGSEFIRVGYYVHNQFLGESDGSEESYPPLGVLITSTKRTILTDKPRVTLFRINWGK